ncbi:hypothetical protein BDZ88DRAFT_453012 [Geranomyces variabilis]|nr:hypothetical protein BDZ88DRAFT_453012 [Geranomyces variabilis]KAJ3143277.1 hypothetical protein HDU90_000034 [Geranomyces variabilis]
MSTFLELSALRNPPQPPLLPPQPPVPRRALLPAARGGTDDDDLPRMLHAFRRSLGRPIFALEAAALDRLRYKNQNAHRSGPHFHTLLAVRRLLARCPASTISAQLADLIKVMHPAATKRSQGRWEQLPPRQDLAHLLLVLASSHRLLRATAKALRVTYTQHRAVAAQSYFMALSLVVMGACARLHVVVNVWIRELEECYAALRALFVRMPVEPRESKRYPVLAAEFPVRISAELFAPSIVRPDSASVHDEEDDLEHYDGPPGKADLAAGMPSASSGMRGVALAEEETLASAISDDFWAATE